MIWLSLRVRSTVVSFGIVTGVGVELGRRISPCANIFAFTSAYVKRGARVWYIRGRRSRRSSSMHADITKPPPRLSTDARGSDRAALPGDDCSRPVGSGRGADA